MRASLAKVDLLPAFTWICPHCQRENIQRLGFRRDVEGALIEEIVLCHDCLRSFQAHIDTT